MAKGRKTGGRQKGTPNKNNQVRMLALKESKASGKDPVTFFAEILRNEGAPLDIRFQAAKELAPYVHPKLASIEARTGGAPPSARRSCAWCRRPDHHKHRAY
jgi:hypothetical protein